MKRISVFLLTLVLALVAIAPTALAAQIEIYGNGRKKSYDIKDKYGKTYHYYDIYDGATQRPDTSDSARFIRSVLNTPFKGKVIRTIHQLWDVLGRNDFSRGAGIRLGGKDVYGKYAELSPHYQNEFKVLVQSQGMEATELAIREKMAQLGRDELGDKSLTASRFRVNEGLKNLKSDGGMTFFSMNAYGKRHHGFMAVGSVFYDFQLGYLEDGEHADSAVGVETDINKVKGKRGVKINDGAYQQIKTSWAENKTNSEVERNVTFDETHSVTMENSVSHTTETNGSYMVGAEVKTTVKIPFVGATDITVKGEYNSGWMASTTKGSSKAVSETLTYHDGVTYKVPPRSKAQAKLMKADGSYSIEYDYPVAITFKVAQYVIYNDEVSQLIAVWGEQGDPANSYATQNLFNRYDHRSEEGYEATHASGYPLNWNNVTGLDQEFKEVLCTYVPMSVTGGSLSMTGSRYMITLENPVPIDKLGSLQVKGKLSFQLGQDATLNLSAGVPVIALADYEQAPIEFYEFDDRQDGGWLLCDASGQPIESDKVELIKDEEGWKFKAGSTPGAYHLKYELLEDRHYNMAEGEGEMTKLVSVPYENDDVKNDTLITVKVGHEQPVFSGSVEIATVLVEAALNKPLDLVREGPDVHAFDAAGNKLDKNAVEYPDVWGVVGGNTQDVAIKAGVLTVRKPGNYQIYVSIGGVQSDPVDLAVSAGEPVSGVELDKDKLVLSKGDSATLKATVLPKDSRNQDVTWQSMNDKVATVDENGRVKAIGTGITAIVVTTKEGGFQAACDVTVEVPASGEALDQAKLALLKGKSFMLGTPGGVSGIWWLDDDEDIVTVSKNGKVTGKKLGETVLRFEVAGAKKGATFMGKALAVGDVVEVPVAVRAKGEVVSKVSLGRKSVTLAPGGLHALTPTLKPEKAPDREVYFKTSNKKVALVDDQGVITGVSPGKATITATSASGKTAKIKVTVAGKINAVALNAKKVKLLPGEAFKLIATSVPAGAEGFGPIFESSKPGVATVDDQGNILALKKGKTTITVCATKGSKIKAKCTVTVK